MKLKSNYALLDVKAGRAGLFKHFERGGDPIPITINGTITGIHGNDDGVSREFTVKVDNLEEAEI